MAMARDSAARPCAFLVARFTARRPRVLGVFARTAAIQRQSLPATVFDSLAALVSGILKHNSYSVDA
jgi:hypothetical protein